jgi:GH18 family chitinase
MMTYLNRIAALALACAAAGSAATASAASHSGKWVTGYYGSYFWDVPDYQAPQHVDMTAMTHFVFARIGPGGGQMGGSPGQIMPGGGTAQSNPSVGPGAPAQTVEDYMISRAHNAGTKALIMLGGAGDETGFRNSTTAAVRPAFVQNLVDYMVAHDYDGIDVDWENVRSAADQAALEALIAELRSTASARPRYHNLPVIITYPAGMINLNIDHVSAHSLRVAAMVDQFNVMSYGSGWFGSGWQSTVSGPLTGHTIPRPMDIASTVQAYVDAGIPRGKIGMGIGFYGVNYKPPFTGPGMATDGYDMSYRDARDVVWNYAMLNKYGYLSHGAYQWEGASQTGYRSYPGGYSVDGRPPAGYVSYEDPASIAAKGAWALSNRANEGAGGAIVWLVNYGTTNGINNPLLAAVKQAFLDPDAPGTDPDPDPTPPVDIHYTAMVDSDWVAGYCATLTVVNNGSQPGDWAAELPFSDTLVSWWNGVFTPAQGKLRIVGQDWNRVVYPGTPRSAGYCAYRPASTTPPTPQPGQVTASVAVASDWGAGYCANVTVSNSGATSADKWSIPVPLQGQVTTFWNGSYVQTGLAMVLSGPPWHKNLAAGEVLHGIGFCARR